MDAINLLEQAIQAEHDAYNGYMEGAQTAEDPETRALFEELASDEAGHREKLTRRLKALKLLRSV